MSVVYRHVGPVHVDDDTRYKAEVAVWVARKHLDLPPIDIQWLMPAEQLPSWWPGKAHERDEPKRGWVNSLEPTRIHLVVPDEDVMFAALHEVRHSYQWLSGIPFDLPAWEDEANAYAEQAMHLPVR